MVHPATLGANGQIEVNTDTVLGFVTDKGYETAPDGQPINVKDLRAKLALGQSQGGVDNWKITLSRGTELSLESMSGTIDVTGCSLAAQDFFHNVLASLLKK